MRALRARLDGGRLLLGTFQQPTVRGKAELYHQGAGTSFYHFQGADTVRCVCYHPQLSLLAIAGDALRRRLYFAPWRKVKIDRFFVRFDVSLLFLFFFLSQCSTKIFQN